MGQVETNIFAITNLPELTTNYRLYRIRGVRQDQEEYYQNLQHITRALSYQLRAPVTTLQRQDASYLVVPEGAGEPKSPFPLVRSAPAIFESQEEVFHLDYSLRTPENDNICLRFLQFLIQSPLHNHPELWQPGSGQAFFKKIPVEHTNTLNRYFGFSLRTTLTSNGGLGLCLDITSKTVSSNPLPREISRDDLSRLKGKHCIYHYGYKWYDIRIDALSDLNTSTYLVPKDNKFITLLDYIIEESKKPLPEELTQIPHDASVVLYHDSRNAERAAPAPLCYRVLGPDDEEAGRQHNKNILPANQRRGLISEFSQRYLKNIRFGNVKLQIAQEPDIIPRKMFIVPDLEFGQEKILSVKGTPGAEHVSLDRLGNARLELLQDKDAGFYKRDRLDRQYLILPKSIVDSCGKQFILDLKRTVSKLFSQENNYDPIVVSYNDRGPKTLAFQSKSISDAIQAECTQLGYAVVMVHETVNRKLREEDQLAALVIKQLRNQDIFSAVIHTKVVQECYQLVTGSNSEPYYAARRDKSGKLNGYLRNIALNKVLLTNQRWPFVLAENLHADITIGIDVKNHTAGLVVINSNGGDIRALLETSRNKEQLYGNQLEMLLMKILKKELDVSINPIKTIVIHRDGRMYPSEIEQAKKAITSLRDSGSLPSDANLTILEIPKSSPVPFRLFEVNKKDNGREWIENPQVGYYHIISELEGYVCSTGRAFPQHSGTVQPLHVRKVYGDLPLEKCLEDIYGLTTLAWTRPEDCSRYPITTKLNDRFLIEDGTEYDEHAVQMSEFDQEAFE